jgi:hypothetical protein
MVEGKLNADGSDETQGMAEWTTPILIACGNMMNVMANSGTGWDGTAEYSQILNSS